VKEFVVEGPLFEEQIMVVGRLVETEMVEGIIQGVIYSRWRYKWWRTNGGGTNSGGQMVEGQMVTRLSTTIQFNVQECETHSYGEGTEKFCYCNFYLCNAGLRSALPHPSTLSFPLLLFLVLFR
jgi:hypothetical protein